MAMDVMGTSEIQPAIEGLLPSSVAVAVWPGGEVPSLFRQEEGAIARAVEERKVEFARGRACARSALAVLGARPQAIPVRTHREPAWPAGFVGSITHCPGVVAAAVARIDQIAAVGIDAEPARDLPTDVASVVLNPSETFGGFLTPVLQTVAFSAKESIHKALFPLTSMWLDPTDVNISLDLHAGRFCARAAGARAASLSCLTDVEGRFSITGGFVLTSCFVELSP